MLNGELLERAIEEQKDLGRNVKGFIFCNPHNPLGVVFDKTLTMELMRVCAKHQVHFISDEIYALSIFDKSEEFESVLQYQENEVFLWIIILSSLFYHFTFSCQILKELTSSGV